MTDLRTRILASVQDLRGPVYTFGETDRCWRDVPSNYFPDKPFQCSNTATHPVGLCDTYLTELRQDAA